MFENFTKYVNLGGKMSKRELLAALDEIVRECNETTPTNYAGAFGERTATLAVLACQGCPADAILKYRNNKIL